MARWGVAHLCGWGPMTEPMRGPRKDSTVSRPKFIIADDNICDTGGHYFELASLLLEGAGELGYDGILATNTRFEEDVDPSPPFQLLPAFATRRMVHWSLGVDGHSRYQRDLDAKSIGGNPFANASINLIDSFRPKRRPQLMLGKWAEGMVRVLGEIQPRTVDRVLINTGDDFAMLALAAALKRCALPPLRIDVIFHFALYEQHKTDTRRLEQLGRQCRRAIELMAPHEIRLHATTTNLAAQMRSAGLSVTAIPYPTRPRGIQPARAASPSEPCRVVLAGLPRAEKGKAVIGDVLAAIENPHLRSGRYQLSMQMPTRRWRSMIPATLQSDFERALAGSKHEAVEVMTNNLTPSDYHAWLDTAGVGLFLYNPDRYVARCSGVLLEMLVRGVPVIVPEGCWLADQVQLAGGDGSIGYIYQRRNEIPDILHRFNEDRDPICQRSLDYAKAITARHCGRNTLLEMGLTPIKPAGTNAA